MSTNALAALVPLMFQLQESFRTADLKHWVSQLDLQELGPLGIVVIWVVFLLDLFFKSYSPYKSLLPSTLPIIPSTSRPFSPPSTTSSPHSWDDTYRPGPTYDNPENSSLEPWVNVLDALAEAVKAWEEPEITPLRNSLL